MPISSYADRFPKANIHPSCVITEGVEIGRDTLIGPFNFIREGTTIGDHCRIGPLNCFEGLLKIGNHVRIGTHCNFGFDTIIQDKVFIGGHTTGANDHKIAYLRGVFEPTGYTIKKAARIGLGVIFMAGITVGEEALVGAGSLVTKDVKDYEVVYGVPAKHKGWINPEERVLL